MTTFLLTFLIVLLAALGLAVGILMGRKAPKGSCGGLGAMGLECHTGCEPPCPRREAQMRAQQNAPSSPAP